MKKLKIVIAFLLCFMLCKSVNVNAAALHFNTISSNQIIGINTFRMNLSNNIILDKNSIVTHNAYAVTNYPAYNENGEATGHPGDGSFKGASDTPYWMYRFASSDAYVSAVYKNVGWYNDGNGERAVNAVMTVYDLHNENGQVTTAGTLVGFNKIAMAWILLNNGGGNGVYSDVQIYFYYADDPTKQPIDMGEAYIGVGGQNSEKRTWNGDQGRNDTLASIYIHTLSTPADNKAGIEGRQWEWLSYDNYLKNKTLEVYKSNDCILKYVTKGQTVYPKDYDTTGGPYSYCDFGWGVASQNCTFDITGGMVNPTGFNVITNAGDRHDSRIDGDINNFTGSFKYANGANDKIMYMVQMGRVTDYSTEMSNIKGTAGRADGKPFSIYNFTSGKDVGSVELAIAPMSLATEIKKPGKTVDKTVVHEQETIKYTITQQVGNMNDENKRIDQRAIYTGLVVTDPLPKEVDFVSAVAKNENGEEIATFSNGAQTSGASNCVIKYDVNTHTLTYTFTKNYLSSTMRYVGETYKFEINTKVRDLKNTDQNDYIASNKANTKFSTSGTTDYVAETEEVHTQVIYDILTKSINASISDMITEIIGGTDNHTVTFTPDLGYYVETVEWQNQSERYAPTTEDLAGIKEIPSANKITIPEEKDGTENTFKHITTIIGENTNLPTGNNKTNMTDEEKNTLNYDPFGTTIFTYNNVDNNHYVKVVAEPMKMVIRISKEDAVTGKKTQGDAKFVNAEYTVYTDYNEATGELTNPVDTIKLDENGNGSSKELLLEKMDANGPYGEYFVKETKAPEGYLIDENVYRVYKTAIQQTIDREKISYHFITSKEEVWKGSVKVIKFENILGTTEERPATGAILRLTLNSSVTEENPNGVYYDVTVDEKGYGEFVNELLIDYYPNTIPYGLYTITEIKESDLGFHTYFYIKPETIDLRNKNEQVEYRIFGEEPIQAYLKVQKVDKDTNSKVKVAGAKYKIWDVQNEKWVSQMVSPSGYFIDEFETNEDGYFITPEKLLSGDYVIYETQAPEGYYLNDEYRIPENSDDLGDATKSGVAVRIDSIAMGLINGDQLIYDPTAELVYEQQIKNDPLKVKLEINKTGEVLSEVIATSSKYGEKYTPKYTIQGLEGVTYDIYAAQDIKSPDRTQTYVVKGTKVDTITTNENGIAITKELYPGEYEIKETDTPMGYIADENIPNVVLTNTNTLKRVEIHNKELTNKRQKLELTFKKVFEDVNFANGENIEKKAIFGVYTNQDINNYKGNVLIPKDKLVDIIEVDENNPDVTSTIDLPEGRYYVKELETSFPYTIGSEIKYFELNYTDNNDEFVVKQGTEYVNNYESASITLVKLSTSTIDNLVLDGENVETNDLDKNVNELIDEFKGMTEDEIKEYLQKNDVKFVSGATYRVYTDKECLKPLYIKSGDKFVEADIVTDESGLIKLENIPVGKYYIKEVVAPKGYQLSEEVLEIELTSENKNAMVYKALIENSVVASIITKSDIFTGDVVPNCVFEIKDDEGRVLLHSITNEDGKAFIPLDLFENGKTYTYTEIEAPEMYELNTEPHEFVAKFDEETYEWLGENIKVENTRKKGKVITSYIDIDTGIEIADREYTGDYVGLDYDTFAKEIDGYELVVELIPANKDGQYTIEDIYVKYYYRKIDNAETGDINIYVLGIILVISTTAMMYTIKRNLIIKP